MAQISYQTVLSASHLVRFRFSLKAIMLKRNVQNSLVLEIIVEEYTFVSEELV